MIRLLPKMVLLLIVAAFSGVALAQTLAIYPKQKKIAIYNTHKFRASGGVAPYTFSLASGVGTVSSDGVYKAPKTVGSGIATIRVQDSIGSVATAAITVRVANRIALVQVMDPGSKIADYKVVFVRQLLPHEGKYSKGSRYNGVRKNLYEIRNSSQMYVDLSQILYDDVMNYGLGYSALNNVTTAAHEYDRAESFKYYNLKAAGTYWENIIRKANLPTTARGPNPKFQIDIRSMIYKKDNFTKLDSRLEVENFFQTAIGSSRELLTSEYDFIMYIQYQTPPCSAEVEAGCRDYLFRQSYADVDRDGMQVSYISFGVRGVELNLAFKAILHEMGHMIFGLRDTYYAANAGLYPVGAPEWDLSKWPLAKGCLMQFGFADKIVSTGVFSTWEPSFTPNIPAHISIFAEGDPYNFDLCAQDKEIVADPTSIYAADLFSPAVVPAGQIPTANRVYNLSEGAGQVPLDVYFKYPHPTHSMEVKFSSSGLMFDRPIAAPDAMPNGDYSYVEYLPDNPIIVAPNVSRVSTSIPFSVFEDTDKEGVEGFSIFAYGAHVGSPNIEYPSVWNFVYIQDND